MIERDAYTMMFRFLEEQRYSRLPSDGLGQLLGEMQLDAEGTPFDRAIVGEWKRAVELAKKEALSDLDGTIDD